MAFVKLTKSMAGSHTNNLSPAIRMTSMLQTGTMTSRTIAFYMSSPVIHQAGWLLEQDDNGRSRTRVAVHEGTGDDAGSLLVEHDPHGYTLGLSKKDAAVYAMTVTYPRFKHYVLDEAPCLMTDVAFVIDEEQHCVLIQCPAWFRFNPSSVPQIQPREGHLQLNRQDRRTVAKRITTLLK